MKDVLLYSYNLYYIIIIFYSVRFLMVLTFNTVCCILFFWLLLSAKYETTTSDMDTNKNWTHKYHPRPFNEKRTETNL